jgi:hypothetical protein
MWPTGRPCNVWEQVLLTGQLWIASRKIPWQVIPTPMRDLSNHRIAGFGEILNQAQNDAPEIWDFSGHRPISYENCPVVRSRWLGPGKVLGGSLSEW